MKNASVNAIAKLCGFSWGYANKLIDGLEKKEKIELNNNNLKIDYTKISQAMLFMAAKIEDNSEDIDKLKDEISIMKSRMNYFEKELFKRTAEDVEYERI